LYETDDDKHCTETLAVKTGKYVLWLCLRSAKNDRLTNENHNSFCSSSNCNLDWKCTFYFYPCL